MLRYKFNAFHESRYEKLRTFGSDNYDVIAYNLLGG